MRGFKIATALLGLMPVPAHAADWWYVTESSAGTVLFVDVESLQRNGDLVTYWRQGINKDPIKGVKSYKLRSSEACSGKKTKVLSYVDYDEAGTVVESNTLRTPTFDDIVPDTVGESIAEFVCAPSTARAKLGFRPEGGPSLMAQRIHNGFYDDEEQ